jgi:hypothetical protein
MVSVLLCERVDVQTFNALLTRFKNGLGPPLVTVFLCYTVVLWPETFAEVFAAAFADQDPAKCDGYNYQRNDHCDYR